MGKSARTFSVFGAGFSSGHWSSLEMALPIFSLCLSDVKASLVLCLKHSSSYDLTCFHFSSFC